MASDTMKKSVRHYENMRDSGIEWIGAVPSHWKTTRMKAIFRTKSVKNHPSAEVLSLYRDFGVLPKSSRDDNHNVTSEDTSQYKYVEKGNLVINKMKAWQGSLAISKYEGIVSPAYYVCEFRNAAVDKKYIHHLLRCTAYAQEFERLSTGMRIGQWDLGIDDFMLVPAILPPLNEQKHIGHYLDTQCLKIDTIISDAKTSIEEYKAWKTSIIYEAVTKGLNPNVEMKDSGIEWIGKIPAHWKTGRVKNCFVNHDEWREPISAENRENKLKLYDYYGASGPIDKIDFFNVDDTVLLIGEDGANLRMRNLPLVYKASGKFWVNNHAHILKVKEPNSYDFMAYLLEAGDYNEYITGSAQPKLSQFNLMRYPISLVPPREQKEIETYLNRRCSKIDEIIEEKKALISDLESYKKSLIFEVVTGKRRIIS